MCCSSVFSARGSLGGVKIGASEVNSSSKLLTSLAPWMVGTNGGLTFLASSPFQSMLWGQTEKVTVVFSNLLMFCEMSSFTF